jgi:type VI secretion system secreted protein VgrG
VGISFYFEHEDGHDRLVFTDNPSGFRPLPGAAEVPFQPGGETGGVFALKLTTDLVPTSYMVHDYNYRRPELDLSACHDVEGGNGGGVVEYGPHVKTAEEAEQLARIRGEERLSRQRVYEGRSGRPALSAGRRASLTDHPRLPGPEPLLFVEVEHAATLPVFSEAEGPHEASYANTFRAIPAGVPYRPPRRTPKPRIHGVVTGIIQPGPGGETGGVARLDAEGRYTVQIHFDTAPPGEQKASHRVRMAQPFAGANYGIHFPLRPGTEVALAFANGDPDRPVILGALFNAAAPSPVVAGNATRHQIKSPTGAIFELVSKS